MYVPPRTTDQLAEGFLRTRDVYAIGGSFMTSFKYPTQEVVLTDLGRGHARPLAIQFQENHVVVKGLMPPMPLIGSLSMQPQSGWAVGQLR